jgi:hypothetical protein
MADREVLPQALQLNPALFQTIYRDLLNAPKTARQIEAALAAIDGYLTAHTTELFGVVIDYLREIGEARSATEIEDHFARHLGVGGVTGVCEYLADQNVISKTGIPVRLTKNSTVSVEEMAFFLAGEAPDAW